MNVLLRISLALALAVWIASPVVNGMGEGGGTGVWVLPRATSFGSGAGPSCGASARQTIPFANPSQDIRLVVSDMSAAVATLTDEVSAVSTPLAVIGAQVVIPASLQQTLIATSTLSTIVIVDAQQTGYYIQLVVIPGTGGFELRIY
ncbi:MAG TPA: hypothetical protein VF384_15310 [Planctomycetota bacterium]